MSQMKRSRSNSSTFFSSQDEKRYRTAIAKPASSTNKAYSYRLPTDKAVNKRSGLTPKLKKGILALIESKKEQKLWSNSQAGGPAPYDLLATSAAAAPAFIPLAPTINQGSTSYQRIGNVIQLVKGELKLRFSAPITGMAPAFVTMYLGVVREDPSVAPTLANFTNLLEMSPGTYAGHYSTTPYSCQAPVNEEFWDIKMRKEYKIASAGATAALSNNDFSACIDDVIDITKFLKKTIRYDDAAAQCLNTELFLFFVINSTTVTAPAALNYPSVLVTSTFRYMDA